MFGLKFRKVRFSRVYTYEELFHAMENVDWGIIGYPVLVKKPLSYLIVFPPINYQNQINISLSQRHGSDTCTVFLSHEISGFIRDITPKTLLEDIRQDIPDLGTIFGEGAKRNEALTDAAADILISLGL